MGTKIRRQNRPEIKVIMSSKIVLHARYQSLYISLQLYTKKKNNNNNKQGIVSCQDHF